MLPSASDIDLMTVGPRVSQQHTLPSGLAGHRLISLEQLQPLSGLSVFRPLHELVLILRGVSELFDGVKIKRNILARRIFVRFIERPDSARF